MLVGGAMLSTVAADNVTALSEISNSGVYYLNRGTNPTANGGYMQAVDGETTLTAIPSSKTDKSNVNSYWSIHWSATEKAYFIYNIGTGMFASGNENHQAVLTSTAVDCNLIFDDNVSYWLLDCGGYFLGLEAEHEGVALFIDGLTKAEARTYGCYFTITPVDGTTLSDAEIAEIDQKIAEGRAAKLEEYRDFIENTAKKVTTSGGQDMYIGEYDYEALEYALDNADKYTLAQIEELYQETLLSRYPQAGKYYRVHNFSRPGSHKTNYMSTLTDGTVVCRTLSAPAFGTAENGFTDDLCLVRLWPVNGDVTQVKIQIPAMLQYLTGANNNSKPGLTSSSSDAYVFELEEVSAKGRYFRFYEADKSAWLTVTTGSGYAAVMGYSITENPNRWLFEEVTSITVPVDANGYATVCLPCGVSLPEGVKAYTVTDFSNGKAYVEELESPIHMTTPWIIKAAAGAGSVELPLENNRNYVNSSMVGNMRVASDVPGRYVPVFSADGIGFEYAEAAESALPGSCYIVSDNIGAVTTVMGANPDAGIEEITADDAADRDLYDLLGRPVKGNVTPGIYINAATKKAIRIK